LNIPHRIKLIMSALPSTIIISLDPSRPGPAGKSSCPYFSTLPTFIVSLISLYTSSTLGIDSIFQRWRISLARSIIIFLLASRISSIRSKITLAEQGPTRFILSTLAAINAVETRSKLVGIVINPAVRSFFEWSSISIRPIRPVFWSSRRSSSRPKRPSVCPKTAPITSGFSTIPSISNLACTTYFIVKVWDAPVNVQLLWIILLYYGNRIMRDLFAIMRLMILLTKNLGAWQLIILVVLLFDSCK